MVMNWRIGTLMFALMLVLLVVSGAFAHGTGVGGRMRYLAHAPIRINGDADFTAANGVISGNGSRAAPYVISGLDIDAHGAGAAIYIGNTSAYFVVRDSSFHNATYRSSYSVGAGIILYNVTNGFVDNVSSDGNEMYGIYIYRSSNVAVVNSIFNSNGNGITVYMSGYNVIENNTCSDNKWYGIYFNQAWQNELYGNAMTDTGIGMFGNRSTFASQIIPRNNTLNGRPVIYLTGYLNNTTLSSVAPGELILGNVSWLKLEALSISNGSDAVVVGHSSHVLIINSNLSNNRGDGIFMLNTTSMVIENSTITRDNEGVCMFFSKNITIIGDNISDNALGINLDEVYNSTVINNTIDNNDDDGISMFYSDNNTVYGNILDSNGWDAIEMDLSSNNTIKDNVGNHSFVDGIDLSTSNNNSIVGNIWGHNEKGIFLNASCDNLIMGNLFVSNGDGAYLDSDSHRNLIYGNSFYFNHNSGYSYSSSCIQAYDASGTNFWNSSSEGNYWLDWANNNNSNDKNKDGIVDWPYSLRGDQVKDYYPLKNATRMILPAPPENLVAKATSSAVNLTWSPPSSVGTPPLLDYRIYRNGTLIATVPASQHWYSDTNITPGVNYTYYVTAVNGAGESDDSASVRVSVPEPVPELGMWQLLALLIILVVFARRGKRGF